MDLTEMLDNLVLDLKMSLDTEISTAEGTRAVNKAVDELSRHLPRERIYEHTWIEAVVDDTFVTPATEDPDYIVDNMDLPNTVVDGSTATLTATLWFDVPRPITFTITDADNSITRLVLVVKGIDIDGVYREERFYRHDGKIQKGKVHFNAIHEIEFSEITGNVTGDILDLGSDEPDLATGGIWLQLDNPVEPGSEVIWSGALKTGIKYAKDTDYEMDYANGRIRMKNGGSLVDATTYYASYDRAPTAIDISAIIPELIRITKVLYPANKVPEQSVAFSHWENMLTIGSPRPGVSQEALLDKEHIAIYYEARHAPPTIYASGSYPALLDELVILGATGHALLMEALQYELAAVTALSSITAVHTLITAALNTATDYITEAHTQVGNMGKYMTDNGGDEAEEILAEITDMQTYLRDLIIKLADGSGAIADGAAYLDSVKTIDLDAATVGAVAWLLEGELKINRLNDGGPDVAGKFADYARAKIQIAQARIQGAAGYFQEATLRLSVVRSYIEEATGWVAIANVYRDDTIQRLGMAQTAITQSQTYLVQIEKYQETAGANLVIADRYRAEAQSRLNEFRATLASKAEYRKRVVSVSVRQPA